MKTIYCLGVMTGTSCDGADLAVLSFNSRGSNEELEFASTRNFPASLRKRLLHAESGQLNIPDTAKLARDYSLWLGKLCRERLDAWALPLKSVLIAVHGQTVWHEPQSHVSVQLIDASVIANETKCTVITSFRQPDLARGGQGAPLVPYYHWLRATEAPFARALPFAIHNVGGIANLTYLTKSRANLIAFDSGPGNALIDLAVTKVTSGKRLFDEDGAIAAKSLDQIDWKLIDKLGKHSYLRRRPPKSTGRELFDKVFLEKLSVRGAALVANATAFTAHTMAAAYVNFVLTKNRKLNGVFVAGGGAKNPTLLSLFSRELARLSKKEIPVAVLPSAFAPAQYLEAMAFARLGLEGLKGKPISMASVTGASEDAAGAAIYPGSNYPQLLKLVDMF